MSLWIDWTLMLLSGIVVLVLFPWIRNRLGAERLQGLQSFITVAVEAAEQLLCGAEGAQKLEYVCRLLAQQGITVDDSVRARIEASVLELKQKQAS